MSTDGFMTVYTIVDRPNTDKPIWVKLGVCFPNRDGSFNIYLEGLPINGKLHVRKNQPETAIDTNDRNQRRGTQNHSRKEQSQ